MRYSKIYDIDWFRFANLITPPFLRKAKHIDWIRTWLNPLEDLSFLFKKIREDAIYKVTHNGQVYSLENVLNDEYDNSERRIFIEDSFFIESIYIYPENDEKPVIVYDELNEGVVYIYDDAAYEAVEFDFVINIPQELQPNTEQDLNNFLIQMRGLVDFYKLASKRYEIKWI